MQGVDTADFPMEQVSWEDAALFLDKLSALQELRRVVTPGGTVRLLEYVRPRRPLRRAIARLWEPWIAWAYGASLDRRTEEYIPKAGLELVKAELVVDELVMLLTARVPK